MHITKTTRIGLFKNTMHQPFKLGHIVDWTHRDHTFILTWRDRAIIAVTGMDNPLARLFWGAWVDGNEAAAEHYHETQGYTGIGCYETREEYERDRNRIWWRAWRRGLRTQLGFLVGGVLCRRFGHPPDQMEVDDGGNAESGPCTYWSCGRCGQGGGGYW